MRAVAATILAVALSAGAGERAAAQRLTIADSFREGVRFFAPLVIPKTLQDAARLREFICGGEVAAVRSARGDPAAVDTIFGRALVLSLGNHAEALLLSTLLTMDHRRVTFDVPLAGPLLVLPLTSEFEEEFAERVAALPRLLYEDSPRSGAGDRDKLQHFFGSAFLTYVLESDVQADVVGRMVERGEDRFVPGERADPRDLRANRQGQRFALSLLRGAAAPPSAFLAVTRPEDHLPGAP